MISRLLSIGVLISAMTIVGPGCNRRPDKERYEPLYRAGKQMHEAVSVGVTLPRYRELLQALATEIEIANDKARTQVEKNLVVGYRDALQTYQNAETAWAIKLKLTTATTVNMHQLPEIHNVIAFYEFERLTEGENVDLDSIMKALWIAAEEDLAIAEARYNGTPEPARQTP